jgi:hypothetical protein
MNDEARPNHRRSRLAPGETPLPQRFPQRPHENQDAEQKTAAAVAVTSAAPMPASTHQEDCQRVIIVDIRLPFWSVIRFLVYLVMAILPAALLVLLFIVGAGGLLSLTL